MPPRNSSLVWSLVLWLAAIVVVAVALRTSLVGGRLSQDSTYDDVGYLIDGLGRARLLQESGVGALVQEFVHRPPHSAVSTGFATAGFLVFGEKDWAPYVFNLLLVAGSLHVLAAPFRRLGSVLPWLALLALASVPLLQTAVVEFRPDYAVGLATAGFCALLVGSASDGPRRSGWGGAGVLFGLALLAKPPFLPHTVVLAAFTAGGVILTRQGCRPGAAAWWLSPEVRGTGLFLLIGVAVALPYYVINGSHVLEYFRTNTFGGAHAALWRVDGGFTGALGFFTVRPPVSDQLGFWFWVFLSVVVVGAARAVACRRWCFFGQEGLLAGAAGLSLAILVVGRHANQFFAVSFQLLLAAAACRIAAGWVRPGDPLPELAAPPAGDGTVGRSRLRRRVLGGGLAALAGWQLFLVAPVQWYAPAPEARPPLDVNRRILETLVRLGRPAGAEEPRQVFLALAGSVSAPTLEWLALKARQPFLFFDNHRASDAEELIDSARTADFVVIARGDSAPYMAWLPANRMQTKVRSVLDAEGFRLLKSFETSGTPIDLLEAPSRIGLGRYELSASGGEGASGFLAPEGPYPQWRLGRVQWGLYPESRIPLPGNGARQLVLRASVRCDRGRRIEGRINGRVVGTHVQSHAGFADFEWTLAVGGDDSFLVLAYDGCEPGSGAVQRAALFRHLELSGVDR